MIKFLKKYHKWLGVIFTIFILLFSVSGIILNHRKLFSETDVNRNYLPEDYRYSNWNSAAVKGTKKISEDSILIYGNIGIWLTDSLFNTFIDFNDGFPKGIDNRKISKVFESSRGDLFAGTYFGLYQFDFNRNAWNKIVLPIHEERIVDVTEKGDTLLVLSRSYLLKSIDYKNFIKLMLPEPEEYDNKIGLFKTLWIIHSGEIWGITGKLIVDLIGLIFIFLSITGLIYFINPFIIKRKKRRDKDIQALKHSSKWNLKWHNKIGWITIVLLIVTTTTGMFLRPPLLIAIANSKIDKIPYSIIDSPNPWFDKLRRIIYDKTNDKYIIATLDGIYHSEDNFTSKLKKYKIQPPLSVMGVNAFEHVNDTMLLVGSFKGLFLWNLYSGNIEDYIKKGPYVEPIGRGAPIGSDVVTGYSKHYKGKEVFFDFNTGAKLIDVEGQFAKMPEKIEQLHISLWNLALEFHTARMYKLFFGNLYILVIPLLGIIILFIQISGFIVWYKKHRR